MKLNQVYQIKIEPKPPYSFKYSTQNPSHFPTPTGDDIDDAIWFSMHWDNRPIGLKLTSKGSVDKPKIEITVYANKPLDTEALIEELAYRFEWYEDYSKFYTLDDDKLTPLFSKFKGMRMFCAENLYDYLMIAILLQNANVKRTTQMTKTMLEKYGSLLEFDGKKIYCFWSPEEILKVSEEELRSLKVGYRAKSFLRASKDYLELDEISMRKLSDEELRKKLLSIYGVGPASLDYLMRDVFHRRNALNSVPPWEAKIYSKILNINSTEESKLMMNIKKRYGEWRAVAIHYLFMDLSWRHKNERIDWMEKLLPY